MKAPPGERGVTVAEAATTTACQSTPSAAGQTKT